MRLFSVLSVSVDLPPDRRDRVFNHREVVREVRLRRHLSNEKDVTKTGAVRVSPSTAPVLLAHGDC